MAKYSDIGLENLKGFFRRGADTKIPDWIPTGHFELDFIINYGMKPSDVDLSLLTDYDPSKNIGIPMGKLIELFGEEGSGKSSLAYRAVGYAQKMGYDCVWIDAENSFSNNLALINGVNKDTLIYADMSNKDNVSTVYHAEDVFDNIVAMCKVNEKRKSNKIGVIVLDSVANLIPKVRMEASAEDIKVSPVARLMAENLGKIINCATRYGVLIIFINQLRDKIGAWGNPETSPGGRALKHLSSLRIKISKKGGKDADIFVTDNEGKIKLIGRKARIRIEKNRFAKPYIETIEIPIYYEPYFPDIEEVAFNVGRQLKVISVYKGEFRWGEVKVPGRSDFIDHLKIKKLVSTLIKEVVVKAKETGVILPPELVSIEIEIENELNCEENNDTNEKTKLVRGGRKKKYNTTSDEDT